MIIEDRDGNTGQEMVREDSRQQRTGTVRQAVMEVTNVTIVDGTIRPAQPI